MNSTADGRRLQGWKQIAAYLGTSVRTAQRWEVTLLLPVHREGRLQRAAVYAVPGELEAWHATHQTEIEEDRKRAAGNADAEPGPPAHVDRAVGPVPDQDPAGATKRLVVAGGSSAAGPGDRPPVREHSRRALAGLGAAVVVVALGASLWFGSSLLRDRQRAQPLSPGAEPSGRTAYSVPVGGSVIVLKIRAGDTVATIETTNGAMATVTLPSGRKLGLAPIASQHGVDLGVAELSPREGGSEALRELSRHALAMSQPLMIGETDLLSVELTDKRPPPASSSLANVSMAVDTCCIACGTVTVCAMRVRTSCGSCDTTRPVSPP